MWTRDFGTWWARNRHYIFIWALCGSLVLVVPGVVWAWAAKDHEDIVVDAIRLAPAEIRDSLRPFIEWIKDGASTPPRVFRDCDNHGFSPLTPKGRAPGAVGPQWSAIPRAMELFGAVVADLKAPSAVSQVTARRIGILGHYVASVVQPPRTSWKCDAERRYGQPVYLGWDDVRIPTDVEAELIDAGRWATEIEERSPKLDSLFYATAVSLTVRIWAAAWRDAGREITPGSAPTTVLFNPGEEILTRSLSIVEFCQDRLQKAQSRHFALWLHYPLYSTLNEIAFAEAIVNFWKSSLDKAILLEAEKRVLSAEDLQREIEELEKGRKEGLELIEQSIVYRDGKLIVNGRFLNHGPNPIADLTVMVQIFNDKGAFIKQMVHERALISSEPEGFLPGTIHRFRIVLREHDLPKFSRTRIVFLRSSSDRGRQTGRPPTF